MRYESGNLIYLNLQKLKLFDGRKAPLSLDIIVIGCGLGGLAAAHSLAHAGHRVTIVESAPAIGEIGAGIQITPNLSRLLIRWGLGEHLKKIAVKPEAIALRRCTFQFIHDLLLQLRAYSRYQGTLENL